MTAIGDIILEFREKPGKSEELPVLTLTERNGFVHQADRFKKRLATDDVSNYKVVRRNDIAFNPYLLWAGAVAQNTIVDAGIISPLYPTFRVREGFDPRYVARLLLTPETVGAYDGIAFGSIPRRRRSSVEDFLNLTLASIPPLDQQRRVAAILDHADALRAKRRQTLAHLDALTQSLFRAMFSGVESCRELGAIARFFGGTSLPEGETFCGQPNGALLMKVSDMNSKGNENKVNASAFWTSGGTPRSATVGAGTVVIPKRGASIATNKKRLTTRVTCLDPNLMGVEPDRASVTSRYLYEWFKLFNLSTITSGSTVPQLNKQDLDPIVVPVPSLALQEIFSIRAERIDVQRAVVQQARARDEELFAALQYRAFRGEL